MKVEAEVAGLLLGFIGAGASCLALFYLNSVVGLNSNDLSVQVFGWGMLVFLLIMACVPIMGLELRAAKRIMTPLEAER